MEAAFLRVALLSGMCSLVMLPLLLFSRRLSQRYAAKTMSYVWILLAVRLLYFPKETAAWAAVSLEAPAVTVALPAAAPLPPQSAGAGGLGTAAAVGAGQVPSVSLGLILAVIWLTGIAVTLAVQLISYLLARRALLRGSAPAAGGEYALLERLRGELAILRSVGLRRSAKARTPMTLGVLRTVIVLPEEPAGAETLELVLRHELLHIRRCDLFYKLVMLFAAAVHWFNPLVWWMEREAGRNLELCCDDEVLFGAGSEKRREYGEILLQNAAEGRFPSVSTQLGSKKHQMKARLTNLFQKKRNSILIVCAIFVLAIGLGGLVACKGAPDAGLTPQEAVDALEASVGFDRDMQTVTFVLPAEYAPASDWNLHVAGRMRMGDDGTGMSLHYFEGETWKPGATYLINLTAEQRADITSLDLDVTLPNPTAEGGELRRTIDLRAWLTAPTEETRTGKLMGFEGGRDDTVLYWREADGTAAEYPVESWEIPVTILEGSETREGSFGELRGELDARALSTFSLTLEGGAAVRLTELQTGAEPLTGNLWPVDGYYHVVKLFGYRIHPLAHTGIDIEAPAGTPVSAAAGGTVAEVGRDETVGDYVIVAHDDFWSTRYAGLKDITVGEGDRVAGGTVVGAVAGEPEGETLHYEWLGEGGATPCDPLSEEVFDGRYVKPDGTPLTLGDLDVPGW